MCEPISISTIAAVVTTAAAVASVAGPMISGNNQAERVQDNNKAAIKAKNTAVADTVRQDQVLNQQATKVFGDTLQPYVDTTPQENVRPAQDQNTAFLQSNAPSASVLSQGALTPNAPAVIQSDANDSIASRLAKISKSNAALGDLTGFDSANLSAARGMKEAGNKMQTFGDFASQNASVGGARLNADVTNSQDNSQLSPLGDILTGAGQIGLYGSGKGWFTPTPAKTVPPVFAGPK